jgi:DNA-binding transcriptional LysR family regulator
MEIDELRWFIAVAEGRTVTAAAQSLHVSQPALSRGLGRLERELGAPLFDRIGRVLQLNQNGQTFLDAARRAVGAVDGATRTIADSADPDHGTVRLAFLNTLGTAFVPALVGDYRRLHPGVDFVLRQGGAERNERFLLDRAVDMVLTSRPSERTELEWRPLLEEPLVLVVPTTHRLAGRSWVRLAEVSEEPFVILAQGFGLRPITERLCGAAGFTPKIAFEGEEPMTLRGLIGAGCGVGLLAPAPAPLPDIVELPVREPRCSRTIGVVWFRGRHSPAAAEAFRDYVLAESRPPRTWSDLDTD